MELQEKLVDASFPQRRRNERLRTFDKFLIVLDVEVTDFELCDHLQQVDDLLLHFQIVHDEQMFTPSSDGSSLYHVEGNSIPHSQHMYGSDILVLHHPDQLDHHFRVVDLPVSQQNYVTVETLHLFLDLHDIEERSCNFGASVVCLESGYFLNCYLHIRVCVRHACLIHAVKFAAKTDDVVNGVLWQRF